VTSTSFPHGADHSGGAHAGHDVRIVRDRAAFAALRDDWESIVDTSRPHQRVFGSHAWFDAALEWQGRDTALELVCFEPEGRLGAVLPLTRRAERMRGMPLRELSFLAVPDTQWCDLVGAAASSEAACVRIVDALEQAPAWDVMRLGWLMSDGPVLRVLVPVLKQRGYRVIASAATRNPTLSLAGTWSAFLASRSRRLKKALNLASNRLHKAGTIEIAHAAPDGTSADEAQRLLEHAVAVSKASWKRSTGNALDRPGPLAFIRRLTQHAHERGWLSLWTLSLDGRPVASEYQLVADGNVYALRSDFDAAYEEISPGTHLNRVLLEAMFGTGLERYYMGPGENAYKLRWRDGDEPVFLVTVYGKTARGALLAAWETTLRPLLARLRDRFVATDAGRPASVERDD